MIAKFDNLKFGTRRRPEKYRDFHERSPDYGNQTLDTLIEETALTTAQAQADMLAHQQNLTCTRSYFLYGTQKNAIELYLR